MSPTQANERLEKGGYIERKREREGRGGEREGRGRGEGGAREGRGSVWGAQEGGIWWEVRPPPVHA